MHLDKTTSAHTLLMKILNHALTFWGLSRILNLHCWLFDHLHSQKSEICDQSKIIFYNLLLLKLQALTGADCAFFFTPRDLEVPSICWTQMLFPALPYLLMTPMYLRLCNSNKLQNNICSFSPVGIFNIIMKQHSFEVCIQTMMWYIWLGSSVASARM